MDERRAGSGVFEEVGDQLRRQLRVDHDDDGAVAENAEERADERRAVGQRDDDALFGPDVGVGQHAGEAELRSAMSR